MKKSLVVCATVALFSVPDIAFADSSQTNSPSTQAPSITYNIDGHLVSVTYDDNHMTSKMAPYQVTDPNDNESYILLNNFDPSSPDATQYSYDGKHWVTPGSSYISLKLNRTIYVREPGSNLQLNFANNKKVYMRSLSCGYESNSWWLSDV